jgi:hypothetical protein
MAQLLGIHAAGLDTLYFAWAGSLEAGPAHDHCLHGPDAKGTSAGRTHLV